MHRAKLVKGSLDSESLEGDFIARIDVSKRLLTCCNHTATHLLHAALRGQISDTIFQSGSLVAPEKLRFDFSWGQPLSEQELRGLEDAINAKVRLGEDVVIHQDVEREHAVDELGAMAIFGEKYNLLDPANLRLVLGWSVQASLPGFTSERRASHFLVSEVWGLVMSNHPCESFEKQVL